MNWEPLLMNYIFILLDQPNVFELFLIKFCSAFSLLTVQTFLYSCSHLIFFLTAAPPILHPFPPIYSTSPSLSTLSPAAPPILHPFPSVYARPFSIPSHPITCQYSPQFSFPSPAHLLWLFFPSHQALLVWSTSTVIGGSIKVSHISFLAHNDAISSVAP